MLRHCSEEADYRTALRESAEKAVLFLKHSIT
jgi:hypothetical protein